WTLLCIYKGGDREDPANYQSISPTTIICKIMEISFKGALDLHLGNLHFISCAQHGFRK
ncbi:unnamed protein product, partial [Dicrocoelium dendriticum]